MTDLTLLPDVDIAFKNLCISPENPRAGAGRDAGIATLRLSMKSGQAVSIFVRPGREGEAEFAILDGRRRYLTVEDRITEGTATPETTLRAKICTTPEQIAKALLHQVESLALDTADFVLSVYDLQQALKTPEEIGEALGIDVKRVRRLIRLGSVGRELLACYKDKLITWDMIQAIARLNRPDLHEGFVQKARDRSLNRDAVEQWSVNAIRADSAVATLISPAEYIRVGGNIESDLFEQEADRWTDVDLVHRLLKSSMDSIVKALGAQGCKAFLSIESSREVPKGMRAIESWQQHFIGKPKDREDACERERRAANNIAAARSEGLLPYLAQCEELALAGLQYAQSKYASIPVAGARIVPSKERGLAITFYYDGKAMDAYNATKESERKAKQSEVEPLPKKTYGVAKVPDVAIEVDDEGFTNGVHQDITKTAGRALALSISLAPDAAYTMLVATMFQQVVLDGCHVYENDRLLKIKIGNQVIDFARKSDVLMHPLIERLETYRQAYVTSGLHPYAWVTSLDDHYCFDLLAILVALQVDASEQEVTRTRIYARAEAAHVAQAIGHDVRTWYRPDAEFYGRCSKRKLIEFADDMKVDTKPLSKLKTAELAAKIFELATEHDYVPSAFSFALAAKPETAGAGETSADQVTA